MALGHINTISGDMRRSVYDTNGDGIVDNSDMVDGKHASDFASASHGTHVIYGTLTTTITPNATKNDGSSANISRTDHTHAIATATAVGLNTTSTNTEGTSTSFSRSDHTHNITGFAPLLSPSFTGTPVAPTPTAGTNTTQIATTAFVKGELTLTNLGITASAAELNYVKGVTSAIQTQINGKAATSHTHTKSQITDFPTSLPASGGNADTVDNYHLANRTNYMNVTNDIVVGQLMWKNFGNNHTIFDASNSTTPSGTSCSNSTPDAGWSHTFPVLMGWNGVNTYGVKVNCADWANSSGDVGGVSLSGLAESKITSGTDLNTITKSGMYRIDGAPNTPYGRSFGQLLVMHGGGDTITQIYSDYMDASLYTRAGNPPNVGGSGSWSPWRKLVMSTNFPAVYSGTAPANGSVEICTFDIRYYNRIAGYTVDAIFSFMYDIIAPSILIGVKSNSSSSAEANSNAIVTLSSNVTYLNQVPNNNSKITAYLSNNTVTLYATAIGEGATGYKIYLY